MTPRDLMLKDWQDYMAKHSSRSNPQVPHHEYVAAWMAQQERIEAFFRRLEDMGVEWPGHEKDARGA